MIDGEHGDAILDCLVALRMEVLVDGDQISHTLIAACYADALRKGETPRSIASDLLESLPLDNDWEAGLREKVEEACDSYEEREAA